MSVSNIHTSPSRTVLNTDMNQIVTIRHHFSYIRVSDVTVNLQHLIPEDKIPNIAISN